MPSVYFKPPLNRSDKIVRETQFYSEMAETIVELIPNRSEVALSVVPESFFHYQTVLGRKCACTIGKSDPESYCPLCYGVGYLPGYTRLGYSTAVSMDETEPRLQIVNLRPKYESSYSPVPWVLDDTALEGYLLTPLFPLISNTGIMDVVDIVGEHAGADVSLIDVYIELDGEFVELSSGTYDALKTQPSTRLKAVLSRGTLATDSPIFYGVIWRYQLFEDPSVSADVPRWTTSEEYSDLGYVPILEGFPMFFDRSVGSIKQGDFFQHVNTSRRFKLVNIQANMPMGKVTSWDCNARRIQDDEILAQIP